VRKRPNGGGPAFIPVEIMHRFVGFSLPDATGAPYRSI
jgi:hypothetical protein